MKSLIFLVFLLTVPMANATNDDQSMPENSTSQRMTVVERVPFWGNAPLIGRLLRHEITLTDPVEIQNYMDELRRPRSTAKRIGDVALPTVVHVLLLGSIIYGLANRT